LNVRPGDIERLKGATRLAVHDAGGVEAAGSLLDLSHVHVSRYQNANEAATFISIDRVAALESLDGVRPHITTALAEIAGCILIPRPRVPADGKWSRMLGEIGKDCGDTIAAVAEALSDDGAISANEIRSLHLREKVKEAIRTLTSLDAALELEERHRKGHAKPRGGD
jgi:hypothetical protein